MKLPALRPSESQDESPKGQARSPSIANFQCFPVTTLRDQCHLQFRSVALTLRWEGGRCDIQTTTLNWQEQPDLSQHALRILTRVVALYVAAAASQLFLQSDLRLSLNVIWMVVTGLTLLSARLTLCRQNLSWAQLQWIGMGVPALLVGSTLFHLRYLMGSRAGVLGWILLALGCSALFLAMRQLLLVLAVTLCTFLLVAWMASPTAAWLYFAFGLITAAGLRFYPEFRTRRRESQRTPDRSLPTARPIPEVSLQPRKQEIAGWLANTSRLGRLAAVRRPSGLREGRLGVERDLRQTMELLRLTGHMARVGGWELDLTTGNLTCSEEIYRIHEVEPGTPMTIQEATGFLTSQALPAISAAVRKCLETREPWDLELQSTTARGRQIWVRVQGESEVREGRIVRLYGACQDVTERLQLQAQLSQAQKMETLGQLAGGVAHDFNNLMTVIMGNAELALELLKESCPQKRMLQEIVETSQRAAGLTQKLLAFGRKQALRPKRLDLNQELNDLGSMLSRLIGENISVSFVLAEDLGTIEVDPGAIEQVIMNLAVNARDAMPDGGSLTIRTCNVELEQEEVTPQLSLQPGSYVLLSVSDTGVGMDEATQQQAFEPFFTTKDRDKGTGLGLSTVYGIVKQNEGGIQIKSEIGQGTTFSVYLPRVADLAECSPESRTA